MVKWCAISSKDDYCAVQKNSVPAGADAVATSRTVFLLNKVLISTCGEAEQVLESSDFLLSRRVNEL